MNVLLRKIIKNYIWASPDIEYVPVKILGYSPRYKTLRMASAVQGSWEVTRRVLVEENGHQFEVDESDLFYEKPTENLV